MNTVLAFCVDPWNWSSGTSLVYNAQTLGDLTTKNTGTTYDLDHLISHQAEIASLYSNYYRATEGDTEKSAAFQIALWEIVSDGNVIASDKTQQFYVDGWNIYDSLIKSQYAMGSSSQKYDLTVFTVDRAQSPIMGQNYIDPLPIPEPTSILLLGVGLIGLGVSRYKKVSVQ